MSEVEPKVYVYEDAPGWTTVEAQDEIGETVRRVDVVTRLFDHDREVRYAQDFLVEYQRSGGHRAALHLVTG